MAVVPVVTFTAEPRRLSVSSARHCAQIWPVKIRVTDIEPGMVGGTEFSGIRYRGMKKSRKYL